MIFRVCYVLGRATGAALHELLFGFWPPKPGPTALLATAAKNDPGVLDMTDTDLDWDGWAIPAIMEVLSEHQWIAPRWGGNQLGLCSCRINTIADTNYPDWVDHVAPIIAARTACDPARAIAALWNLQLKQGAK